MGIRSDSLDLLRAACEATRTRFRLRSLDAAGFAVAARAHARARLVRLGREATDARVDEALARMCLEDLCLAYACDTGSEAAWQAFHEAYLPRLTGLAYQQGCDRERGEAEVGGLLADLALPPARGGVATLLGTYRGTGSLFGWLAVILARRIRRAGRHPRTVSLAASGEEQAEPAVAPSTDPAGGLLDEEVSAALRSSLRAGWSACTPRERLALVCKYRDGLRHREIAERLGVGVPRVSQLLQQGLTRLGEAARRALPEGIDARAREVALRAVEESLATFQAQAPPTGERGEQGDHP